MSHKSTSSEKGLCFVILFGAFLFVFVFVWGVPIIPCYINYSLIGRRRPPGAQLPLLHWWFFTAMPLSHSLVKGIRAGGPANP